MHILLTAAAASLPDSIEINYAMVVFAWIGLMVGAVVGPLIVIWAFVSRTPRISVLLLGLAITIGTIGLATTEEIKPAHRTALAVAAVEEAYGVVIPGSAAKALDFPNKAPKPGLAEQFGTATIETDGIWRKIALVWDGERMLLAEVDLAGLPFAELEPLR